MTDLRQRKGDAPKDAKSSSNEKVPKDPEEIVHLFQEKMRNAMDSKVRSEANGDETEAELRKKVDEDLDKLFKPKEKPLPGLKHKTKAAKDALTNDPYNLECIQELGQEYLEEEKWVEAGNVLLRGWKRVSEFPNADRRFQYLSQLVHCSFQCMKFRQAHAVFMDIESPEPVDWKKDYFRMGCKVHAMNNDLQKSLKAFHEALELCVDFEEGLALYFDTFRCLQEVGAYEAAKSSLEKRASSDDDRNKMNFIETIGDIKKTGSTAVNPRTDPKIWATLVACLIALCFIIYVLHGFEQRSLKGLKLVKDH